MAVKHGMSKVNVLVLPVLYSLFNLCTLRFPIILIHLLTHMHKRFSNLKGLTQSNSLEFINHVQTAPKKKPFKCNINLEDLIMSSRYLETCIYQRNHDFESQVPMFFGLCANLFVIAYVHYHLTSFEYQFQISFKCISIIHHSSIDLAEPTALVTIIATWCELCSFSCRRIPDIHHPHGPFSKACTSLNTSHSIGPF